MPEAVSPPNTGFSRTLNPERVGRPRERNSCPIRKSGKSSARGIQVIHEEPVKGQADPSVAHRFTHSAEHLGPSPWRLPP